MTAPASTCYTFTDLPDMRVRVAGGRADYTIDPSPRGWSCTCPAFGFAPAEHKTCKHVEGLRAHLAAKRTEDLAGAIERETAAVMERAETMLRQLEAQVDPAIRAGWLEADAGTALERGDRMRAWWLRARATALRWRSR